MQFKVLAAILPLAVASVALPSASPEAEKRLVINADVLSGGDNSGNVYQDSFNHEKTVNKKINSDNDFHHSFNQANGNGNVNKYNGVGNGNGNGNKYKKTNKYYQYDDGRECNRKRLLDVDADILSGGDHSGNVYQDSFNHEKTVNKKINSGNSFDHSFNKHNKNGNVNVGNGVGNGNGNGNSYKKTNKFFYDKRLLVDANVPNIKGNDLTVVGITNGDGNGNDKDNSRGKKQQIVNEKRLLDDVDILSGGDGNGNAVVNSFNKDTEVNKAVNSGNVISGSFNSNNNNGNVNIGNGDHNLNHNGNVVKVKNQEWTHWRGDGYGNSDNDGQWGSSSRYDYSNRNDDWRYNHRLIPTRDPRWDGGSTSNYGWGRSFGYGSGSEYGWDRRPYTGHGPSGGRVTYYQNADVPSTDRANDRGDSVYTARNGAGHLVEGAQGYLPRFGQSFHANSGVTWNRTAVEVGYSVGVGAQSVGGGVTITPWGMSVGAGVTYKGQKVHFQLHANDNGEIVASLFGRELVCRGSGDDAKCVTRYSNRGQRGGRRNWWWWNKN